MGFNVPWLAVECLAYAYRHSTQLDRNLELGKFILGSAILSIFSARVCYTIMCCLCKFTGFLNLSVFCVVGLLSTSPLLARFDKDFSTWQALSVTFYEDDAWRLKAAAQTRWYDDSSFLATWFVNPIIEYKCHPNLDIGGTYLLEDVRAQAGHDFTRVHIFRLYLSPHWKIDDRISLSMRHLLALRAIESRDNQWVSRHRVSCSYKVADMGVLTAVGLDTEVFYNYSTDRLTENRFKPLKLSFRINKQTKFELFYMFQSKRFGSDQNWQTAYVFGQSLSYKF